MSKKANKQNKTKNTKKLSICQFPKGDWNYTIEYYKINIVFQ